MEVLLLDISLLAWNDSLILATNGGGRVILSLSFTLPNRWHNLFFANAKLKAKKVSPGTVTTRGGEGFHLDRYGYPSAATANTNFEKIIFSGGTLPWMQITALSNMPKNYCY